MPVSFPFKINRETIQRTLYPPEPSKKSGEKEDYLPMWHIFPANQPAGISIDN
jgi:hypothetical protein